MERSVGARAGRRPPLRPAAGDPFRRPGAEAARPQFGSHAHRAPRTCRPTGCRSPSSSGRRTSTSTSRPPWTCGCRSPAGSTASSAWRGTATAARWVWPTCSAWLPEECEVRTAARATCCAPRCPPGPTVQTRECLRVADRAGRPTHGGRSAILFRGPDPEDGRETTTRRGDRRARRRRGRDRGAAAATSRSSTTSTAGRWSRSAARCSAGTGSDPAASTTASRSPPAS